MPSTNNFQASHRSGGWNRTGPARACKHHACLIFLSFSVPFPSHSPYTALNFIRVGSIFGRWLIQLQLTEQDGYRSLLLLSTSILLFGIVLLNSSSSIPVTLFIHHSYPKHHWSYIPKNVDTGIPLSLYDFFVTSFGIAVNPTTCNHLREATFYRRILHHNHRFSSTIPRVSISRLCYFYSWSHSRLQALYLTYTFLEPSLSTLTSFYPSFDPPSQVAGLGARRLYSYSCFLSLITIGS